MKYLIVLLTILFLSGCSLFQYQAGKKFKIKGLTASPENVAIGLAMAEDIRADAKVKNVCAKNPAKCRAMELSVYGGYGYGGFGYLDTPEGYTWAGIQAVQQFQKPIQPQQKKKAKQLPAVKKPEDKEPIFSSQNIVPKKIKIPQ